MCCPEVVSEDASVLVMVDASPDIDTTAVVAMDLRGAFRVGLLFTASANAGQGDGSLLVTRSRRGAATGRCGGHAQVSRQAKHYAHRGINALMSCDKAFQDPCHSATRERKYVQQHIRICTHGVRTGLG